MFTATYPEDRKSESSDAKFVWISLCFLRIQNRLTSQEPICYPIEWMARIKILDTCYSTMTHSFISMSQKSVMFDVIGFLENVQIHNQLWFVGSSGPSFAAGATVQQSWVVGCQAH